MEAWPFPNCYGGSRTPKKGSYVELGNPQDFTFRWGQDRRGSALPLRRMQGPIFGLGQIGELTQHWNTCPRNSPRGSVWSATEKALVGWLVGTGKMGDVGSWLE